jgi:A/G-specific adenine glycosylase
MSIPTLLIHWYREHRRDLPWRRTRDAYAIWVSEVILQQTRVDQGLPYYQRFIEAFPDAASLAAADLQEVLGLWQGLGYYSRARNMHQAAWEVTTLYGGKMPVSYAELIRLKGVGDYTAAAVASIAASEKVPVIDGNVIRVICRLYGISDDPSRAETKRQIREAMLQLMQAQDAGELNQAVMEFGALQCVPRSPDCAICPLNIHCQALREKKVDELPFRRAVRPPRNRYLNYLVIDDISRLSSLWLTQRNDSDIWKGLWTFPHIEGPQLINNEELLSHPDVADLLSGFTILSYAGSLDLVHLLSHQRLACRFHKLICEPGEIPDTDQLYKAQPFPISTSPPMPRLMHRYLEMSSGLNSARNA